MTSGEKIQKFRKMKSLSQEKIAELVGVSRQAVTKWEANQSVPSTENLLKLAEVFGVSIDELVANQKTKIKEKEDKNFQLSLYTVYKDMKKTIDNVNERKGLFWVLLTSFLILYSCFSFPNPYLGMNGDFFYSFSLLLLLFFIDIIFVGLIKNRPLKVYFLTSLFMLIGLVFRYFLEYGEVSNTRNFTWFFILNYLVLIPIVIMAGYSIISRLIFSNEHNK